MELTLALHRVFDSPRDVILWDTGHQAYTHKLITGRRDLFAELRQPDGLSGYPSRSESEHDWIENSHASTALSYAHGIVDRFPAERREDRHVVAVLGDGSLTGGMAYEALNNLGHASSRVVIVLNDNGRSYSPTISKLSTGLTNLRLSPSYIHARERIRKLLREIPALGALAYSGAHGLTIALREIVTPHRFFEALGIRYVGPVDGHDMVRLEADLARAAEWDGPILLHVLTQKGRGYPPAEDDDVQNLHDFKVPSASVRNDDGVAPVSYSDAFTRAMLDIAEKRDDVFAITAAMAGPTGLLPFQARYPDRFLDVGIAEQHAVTAAAGMAMAGLRPVVAVYSTFFSRAFDQANLDVGLHKLPVVFFLDRAGITGDDGPSHHGVLDLSLTLSIPNMTVFAPSSAQEVPVMLEQAMTIDGPVGDPGPEDDGPPGEAGGGRPRDVGTDGAARRWIGVPVGHRKDGRGGGERKRALVATGRRRDRVGCAGRRASRPVHARRRCSTLAGGDDRRRDQGRWSGNVPRGHDAITPRARPAPSSGADARAAPRVHPPREARCDPCQARARRRRRHPIGHGGSGDRTGAPAPGLSWD